MLTIRHRSHGVFVVVGSSETKHWVLNRGIGSHKAMSKDVGDKKCSIGLFLEHHHFHLKAGDMLNWLRIS